MCNSCGVNPSSEKVIDIYNAEIWVCKKCHPIFLATGQWKTVTPVTIPLLSSGAPHVSINPPNASVLPLFRRGEDVECVLNALPYFTQGRIYTVEKDCNPNDPMLSLIANDLGQPDAFDVRNFKKPVNTFQPYPQWKVSFSNSHNCVHGTPFGNCGYCDLEERHEKIKEPTKAKCECGAHSVGSNKHDSWCKLSSIGVEV